MSIPELEELIRVEAHDPVASVVPEPVEAPRFRLIPHSEITVGSSAVYLVKGLVPRTGLTIVWGPSGCGKTFVTHDMAMHVALGREYRGRRVKQGPVVYFAAEGASGFRARVEAYRRRRLQAGANVPFFMIDAGLSLIREHNELIGAIKFALTEMPPALVVLDTLNRTYEGSESNDQDMTAYVNAACVLKSAFNCAVVVVHHSGLDTARMRGHTALIGAADASLSVKRDHADRIVMTVEKMKDGEAGEELSSELEQVDVGLDEDGETITSCVVSAIDGRDRREASQKSSALTPAASVALRALHEAIEAKGRPVIPGSAEIPPSVARTVTRQDWREFAVKRGISTSDKEAAIRNALDRASISLVEKKRIGVWENHVWPIM